MTVFGVDPQILLEREAEGGDVPYGALPRVIEQCLSEIESRGLTEVGICKYQVNAVLVLH